MKNIDKIKLMHKGELIELLTECSCDHCAYNNTNCMHDMCTLGITKWLEQEAEITQDDVRNEFDDFCHEYGLPLRSQHPISFCECKRKSIKNL